MNHRWIAIGLLLLSVPGLVRSVRADEDPPAAAAPAATAPAAAAPPAAAPEAAGSAQATAEAEAFFESRVRPLLAKRCFSCHAAETQEGGLRLDSRDHVLAGADGQPVVVAGQPAASRLVAAVRRQGELHMPPDDKLPAAEVETLVTWVKLGLPWPKSERPAPPTLTRQQRYDLSRQDHWAYQPIERPALPVVAGSAWVQNRIDPYVLQQLELQGLAPSGPADRGTLIRRVSFDLLGLPPSPEEVAAFVEDPRDDAYARLIDRLLASPRYGERWGRHWLDVARYADTKGYAFAQERRYPYAYTYRDYVIGAWNQDLPYDRFLLEQLAADLLPLDGNAPQLAALGFLTVGRKFNNRHDDIDDQIDVVCRGLMGITVGCARCHDHKYDAIPTEDYYSLYGVFASSQEPGELPLIGEPTEVSGYEKFKAELDKRQQALDAYQAERLGQLQATAREQCLEYLVRAVTTEPENLLQKLPFLSLRPEDLKPPLIERWRKYLAEQGREDHPLWGPLKAVSTLPDDRFAAEAAQRLQACLARDEGLGDGQLNPLLKQALLLTVPASKAEMAQLYGRLLTEAHAAWKAAGATPQALDTLPPATRQWADVLVAAGGPTDLAVKDISGLLTRAERNKQNELKKQIDSWQASSPAAPPRAMVVRENDRPHDPRVFIRGNHGRPGDQVPRQFLYVLTGPRRKPFAQGGGRLELAQAITDAHNPLTRRVIANRIWMHHFGEPLFDTPSDFGARNDPPRHRNLLDYLAWSLADHNWSLKALHREILLSSTYQQASAPRTDALERDPENRLFWRMNPRRLEFEPLRDALMAVADRLDSRMGGRPVDLEAAPFSGRRAVYGFIDRQDLPNLLRVFDFASPDQSSARRPQTTVPQQALYLMNSPLVIQQAAALLQRPDVTSLQEPSARIQRLYALLFARPARDMEVEVGRQFVSELSGQSEMDVWRQYAQLLLLSNEFVFVE